jgi:hypothetical protein
MATAKTSAEKKPAATKAATTSKAKSTVEKKAAAKKAPAKKASPAKPKKTDAADRYKMTEVAAYYIAERNNFAGSAVDYWIAAEAEITKKLAK